MAEAHSLFNSILVPIDDSQSSMNAGRMAVRLAEQSNSRLFFVYVVDPSVVQKISGTSGKEPRLVETELTSNADSRLNSLSRLARDTSLDSGRTIRNGDLSGEIEDLAEKQHADLIVIGQLDNGGREQSAEGSITEQVIEHAPCPVLVVQ
jgi:nucleotide-binding universal stress UspA family protein